MLMSLLMWSLLAAGFLLIFGHFFTGSLWVGMACVVAGFSCAIKIGRDYRKKQESYSRYEREK